jgi:hypothetical protein
MRQQTSRTKTSAKRTNPACLKPQLDKKLLAYAMAASAAGVGVLATAKPAEAHIVATPANISIPENGGIIEFDVNGDGIPDFGLSAHIYEFAGAPPMGNFTSWLRVVPAQAGNAVWGVSSEKDQCAAAVRGGASVNDVRPFKPEALVMLEAAGSYTHGRKSYCPWRNENPPYLGLKFLIDGEVHYGWARVNAALRNTTLTGYAYETIADKPIAAGATDSSNDDLSSSQNNDENADATAAVNPNAGLGGMARGAK